LNPFFVVLLLGKKRKEKKRKGKKGKAVSPFKPLGGGGGRGWGGRGPKVLRMPGACYPDSHLEKALRPNIT
jgi:hypothetical protein